MESMAAQRSLGSGIVLQQFSGVERCRCRGGGAGIFKDLVHCSLNILSFGLSC